jgi:hypothetical protein
MPIAGVPVCLQIILDCERTKCPGVRCPVIPVSNNEMIEDTMLEVFNPVKTASNTK